MATVVRLRELVVKRRSEPIDLLVVFIWLTFLGFNFFVSYGLPRYAFPMMGAISVMGSALIVRVVGGALDKKVFWTMVVISMALSVYDVIAVGDLIYHVNYVLKEGVLSSKTGEALDVISWKLCLYVLPLPFVSLGLRKLLRKTLQANRAGAGSSGFLKLAVMTLAISTVSANLSLNFIQAAADYDTGFGYGARGTKRVLDIIEEEVGPGQAICAEIGLTCSYNLSGGDSPYCTMAVWNDKNRFVDTLETWRVASVIYGPTSNTVRQLRDVLERSEVQDALLANFDKTVIGSYTVWLRRSKAVR
jgi:hypothetical protein